jgi:hypothetical protein
MENEWTGTPYWLDPDNFWVDDETEELVCAATGKRFPRPEQPYPTEDDE